MNLLPFCLICNRKLSEHTDRELVICAEKICKGEILN
jgi:hypothetical protein